MTTTNKSPIVPSVGMGASYGFNGDRYPATVVEVKSPKTIVVTHDSYKVTEKNAGYKEGPLECEFTTNLDGEQIVLTKRKNNRWVRKGHDMWSIWSWYKLGERYYSQNPHF
jgi:hypothetical protein